MLRLGGLLARCLPLFLLLGALRCDCYYLEQVRANSSAHLLVSLQAGMVALLLLHCWCCIPWSCHHQPRDCCSHSAWKLKGLGMKLNVAMEGPALRLASLQVIEGLAVAVTKYFQATEGAAVAVT